MPRQYDSVKYARVALPEGRIWTGYVICADYDLISENVSSQVERFHFLTGHVFSVMVSRLQCMAEVDRRAFFLHVWERGEKSGPMLSGRHAERMTQRYAY